MSLWNDIQLGRPPWRPKLGRRSVLTRLASCLPFLAMGFIVLYCVATSEVRLQRNAQAHIDAVVTRRYMGIPLFWQKLQALSDVQFESEMRTVEKIGSGTASNSSTSFHQSSVSRIVLIGGTGSIEQLAVSRFRHDLDSEHHSASIDLLHFLKSDRLKEIKRSIPYGGSPLPPLLAMIFTFGLGGFIFASLLIDTAIWLVQKRYKKY